MFIENVHREHSDELTGAKIVTIKTKKTTTTTPRRSGQNTWCNIFKKDKECRGKPSPTSWIEISNKIPDEQEMKDTIDNLGKKSDYLQSLTTLFRKSCVIEYFPSIGNVKFNDNGKEKITTLVNLGIFSKADIIGIPDFNENMSLFKEKIKFTDKLFTSHPEGDNHDFIPYIRSDSTKFKDKLSTIVNEDINRIGIDYRGFSAVNKTNFNRLQNFVRDLDKDIFVKVGHLPRKIYTTNASAPHLMFYFGADITADRVNSPPFYKYDKEKKEMPPRDFDTIEYFSPSDLGVMQKDDLPKYFGVDCNCPYHNKERFNKDEGFFSNNADVMADRSIICEMYSSNLECDRSKIAINEDKFLEYLKNKRCIRDSLGLTNNTLNGYFH